MKRLSLIVLALLAFAAPAKAAWNAAGDVNIETDPVGAKSLMDFAENMPWAPDGEDTGKYLYILADAGCGATQQLYDVTRKYTKTMQMRWIFVDAGGEGVYNSLYEERTPEAVKAAFTKQMLPDDKNPEKAAKIELYVFKGVAFMMARQVITPKPDLFAFPTLIYGNNEKAVVQVGIDPSAMDELIQSIPTVPVKKDFTPLALTADQSAVKLHVLPDGYRYRNAGGANTPMYMMPDQNSPRVGSILPDADWPIPCVGVTESGYIAMQITPSGGCVYCYDPAEAKRLLEKK